MLDHLRQHVVELLESVESVTLTTYGLAGIQAQVLPCEARELRLFILTPATSEHLYNLEHQPAVVVTATDWQLRGRAHALAPTDVPADLALSRSARARSSVVLEVEAQRLQVGRANGWGFQETIDITEEDSAA